MEQTRRSVHHSTEPEGILLTLSIPIRSGNTVPQHPKGSDRVRKTKREESVVAGGTNRPEGCKAGVKQ